MAFVAKAAKAVFAMVAAFVAGLGSALVSGESLADVDAKTWLFVIGLTLAAGGGVYGISNKTT